MPKQYLSAGDFIDLFVRVVQRGGISFLGKLISPDTARTRATFDHNYPASLWNMVPAVQRHLNRAATGNGEIPYELYIIDAYAKAMTAPRLLSLGCGSGGHEIRLAENGPFEQVYGIDLAPGLIARARRTARERGIENAVFESKDFLNEPVEGSFDMVLFHQSLHHFTDFRYIFEEFLPGVLRPDGLLVLHEYVGPDRLQWTDDQLTEANQALRRIPPERRRIFRTPFFKSKIYRPGLWRMQASDPSEAAASSQIIPALRKYTDTVEEKSLGGNILHLVLKDIAHHFCPDTDELRGEIDTLIRAEQAFLKNENSDFIFGVYRLKQGHSRRF